MAHGKSDSVTHQKQSCCMHLRTVCRLRWNARGQPTLQQAVGIGCPNNMLMLVWKDNTYQSHKCTPHSSCNVYVYYIHTLKLKYHPRQDTRSQVQRNMHRVQSDLLGGHVRPRNVGSSVYIYIYIHICNLSLVRLYDICMCVFCASVEIVSRSAAHRWTAFDR